MGHTERNFIMNYKVGGLVGLPWWLMISHGHIPMQIFSSLAAGTIWRQQEAMHNHHCNCIIGLDGQSNSAS